MLKWEAQKHFLVHTWMRPAMEEKGQALDFPFSPRTLSCRGRRTPQTIKHVASQGRAAGLQLDRKVVFFLSLYLCGLLLVTLQSNNLQVWAINTATTASASISSGVSWVPVHEERSTERASTNTSRQTHTNIYSSSCSQSPTHTCTYIDTKTLMGWIQTITEHETQIVTYAHIVTVFF